MFSRAQNKPISAFWGENVRIFNEKTFFLRFATIFNSEAVYYIYVTNKK